MNKQELITEIKDWLASTRSMRNNIPHGMIHTKYQASGRVQGNLEILELVKACLDEDEPEPKIPKKKTKPMKITLKPIEDWKDKILLREYRALRETLIKSECLGTRDILYSAMMEEELTKRGLAI